MFYFIINIYVNICVWYMCIIIFRLYIDIRFWDMENYDIGVLMSLKWNYIYDKYVYIVFVIVFS